MTVEAPTQLETQILDSLNNYLDQVGHFPGITLERALLIGSVDHHKNGELNIYLFYHKRLGVIFDELEWSDCTLQAWCDLSDNLGMKVARPEQWDTEDIVRARKNVNTYCNYFIGNEIKTHGRHSVVWQLTNYYPVTSQ